MNLPTLGMNMHLRRAGRLPGSERERDGVVGDSQSSQLHLERTSPPELMNDARGASASIRGSGHRVVGDDTRNSNKEGLPVCGTGDRAMITLLRLKGEGGTLPTRLAHMRRTTDKEHLHSQHEDSSMGDKYGGPMPSKNCGHQHQIKRGDTPGSIDVGSIGKGVKGRGIEEDDMHTGTVHAKRERKIEDTEQRETPGLQSNGAGRVDWSA